MNKDLKIRLQQLPQTVVEIKQGMELELISSFYVGAKDNDIKQVASCFNNSIPTDYIDFLKFSNGCILFDSNGIDGFKFLGTNNICQVNEEVKRNYEEDWDDSIIIFCEVIGEGNYLGFRHIEDNKYEILDSFHEYLPFEWETIPMLFDDFLKKLLDGTGDKFWPKSK